MTGREWERWLDPHWRDRVFAWWEGYDIHRLTRDARRRSAAFRSGAVAPASGPAEPLGIGRANAGTGPVSAADPFAALRALEVTQLDRRGEPVWSVDRMRGAQALWGEDQTGPQGGPWMVDAVRPFGLSPARSVLDLSAGLGGPARAIATAFDTWVTGLEPSPVLARAAMDRSKSLGLSKRVPVAHYDPEHLNQAGSFDLVLGDRILHRVRDKGWFLDQIQACTKPQGGILFFDYVVEGTPRSWEQWNGWRQEEPQEVYPWSGRRVADELVQRNLDLRIAEDVTAAHRALIMDGMRRLASAIEAEPPDGGVLSGLARELAVWWARLKVLGAGLGFYRFVAYRTA
jgi:2-polyprenyl-3-methyl-5-hydroxy-6-metoxy-1,4-benzoquinol methylase